MDAITSIARSDSDRSIREDDRYFLYKLGNI